MTRIVPHSPKKRRSGGYHAHEYGTPQKNQVYGRMDAGQSLLQISRETLIHRNTLSKWCKQRRFGHFTERRTGKNRPGPALKLILKETQKVLHWILNRKYQGRVLSFSEVCQRLNLSVTPRTLSRKLAELGYHKCKACPKPFITPFQQSTRLQFCNKYKKWTHDWTRVRFSDECTFYTGKHKKDQILRKPGERYCTDCIQNRYRSGRTSFPVWGMVGWGYKSELVFLENLSGARGGMTKEDYIRQVLMRHVCHYFSKANYISPYKNEEPGRELGPILFQEDGNRTHGLKGKNNLHDLKKKLNIPLLNDGDWPPSSPDLNIIENCWRIIKQRIGTYENTILTLADMRKAVKNEWAKLDQREIDNLVVTMASRIKQCKDREGLATKW